MTTLTVKEVAGERSWSGQYGDMTAFRLVFDTGEYGEVVTKGDTAAKRREELKALIGKSGEFTLEDQGSFPDGKPKPKKVTNYPGKPQPGTGRGAPQLSLADRLVLDSAKDDRTDARCALIQAVAFHGDGALDGTVLDSATKYLGWLRVNRSDPSPLRTGSDTAGGGASPPFVSPPATHSGATTDKEAPGPREGSERIREPQAPEPEGWGPDAELGKAADGPQSKGKHEHGPWQPAPNADAAKRGVVVCAQCGHAERRTA